MPSYKLIYFNLRGRAEICRWLFKYAGVEFEDVRYEWQKWDEEKKGLTLPFGQVPCLEITEESETWTLAQSHAIERYLAREFGLLGKTAKDAALADSYAEQCTDAIMLLPWYEKDEEKKKKLMIEVINGELIEKIKKLESFVQENGVLVGDGLSLADIGFAASMEFVTIICPNVLDAVPKLKALNEKVRTEPKIAAWIAQRPDTHI